jgi:ABC-type transport system involved in cytochrome bd biosynthesis fused ATPase/permease subunit
LDEATNSLDEQNETEILHRIKEKRSALITFLVAHHFRDFSILTKVLDFQGNGKIISSSL